MSIPGLASGSTPPPPPPPPPLDPAKQADELMALNTHEVCKGARCRSDTDGVAVGTHIAGAAATDPKQARAVFDKAMDKTPQGSERREIAQGLVQTMTHAELRGLAATPDGRALLERVRAELQVGHHGADKTAAACIESALWAADLQKDAGFKKLDVATQQRLLNEVGRQQEHPKAVVNLVGLVRTPSFEAASPGTRSALLDALSQHPQDSLFREGLGKLAGDAPFQSLNQAQKTEAIAAFDKIAKGTAYQGSAGSPAHGIPGKHVSAEEQQKVLDHARQLVTSTGFHDVGAGASRDALLGAFNRHASDGAFTSRLMTLANDPGFLALNDKAKETRLLERYGSDKAFAQGMDKLLANAKYAGLAGGADRAKVLGDMVKLSQTDSCKEASPAHRQAMVEIMGDISAFSAAHPDRTTLRHSLDKVVDGSIRLTLYQQAPKVSAGQTFHNTGSADSRGINLNIHPATQAEAAAKNLYIDALPHEVNHYLNGHTRAGTADRLLDEYRAAVVGQQALLGRSLTPAEQRAELDNLVDGTNSGYSHLAHLYNHDAKVKAVVDGMRATFSGATNAAAGATTPAATVSPEDMRARLLSAGKTSEYLNKPGNLDNH